MAFIRPRSYPYPAMNNWVDILTTVTRSSGPLFTTTKIRLAIIALICLSDVCVALEPPRLAQIPLSDQTTSQSNMLLVNPSVKDETIGNGSKRAPFKTITQALQIAKPNTVIVLSSGIYSTSSGETFPLILKPGVSIQGNARTRGHNIVIQGGGTFLSPTFARQNITILGANQTSVTGVSVTNPNPRGYGIWIESSSPVITDNTFTKNSHDGISITGNSAPTIRRNYFHQNGANGMTIYGMSRPEVRENVFEKTGFGINISQTAAPLLVGNRIIKNRAGIVAQANARPILRGNVIEDNKEDGLVAIANSQPDVGTKAEPGGNVFRRNGRYDINSSATSLVIPAFGNQLATARTSGKVNLAGTGSLVAARANQSPQNPVLKLEPASSQSIADTHTTTTSAIEIPVPPPISTQVPPTLSNPPEKLNFIQINSLPPNQSKDSDRADITQQAPVSDSDAIEIPIPAIASVSKTPPLKQNDSSSELPVLKPAPIVTSELLPVPGSNVPIGKPPNSSIVVPTRIPSTDPPLPPTRATALGLRYRVVVEVKSKSEQNRVRSLVPGAFRTFSKGRVLMQVGAFSDRAKASKIRQMLSSKGLKAAVEQLN